MNLTHATDLITTPSSAPHSSGDGAVKHVPVNSQFESLGLRERKRRETQLRIADVATRLFLEQGYDNVTLEHICEEAKVSRRTFFNYFQSKDHVALGPTPPPISDEEADRIAELPVPEGSTLPHEIMALLTRRHAAFSLELEKQSPDPVLNQILIHRRYELLRRQPTLGLGKLSNTDHARLTLRSSITRNLAAHPEHRCLPHVPVEEEASVITMAALVTMWVPIMHPQQPDSRTDIPSVMSKAAANLTAVFSAIDPQGLLQQQAHGQEFGQDNDQAHGKD